MTELNQSNTGQNETFKKQVLTSVFKNSFLNNILFDTLLSISHINTHTGDAGPGLSSFSVHVGYTVLPARDEIKTSRIIYETRLYSQIWDSVIRKYV